MRTQKAERRDKFSGENRAASETQPAPESGPQDAAAALAESERRFKDFADVVSDWIWETGPDLRFTYLSARFEELTRLSRHDVMGRTLLEIGGANFHEETWQRHVEDYLAQRPFKNFRFTAKLPSGELRHFLVSGKPFFDVKGELLGYRGTGRDVTESERTHESLHATKARLEHLLNTSPAMIYSFKAGDNHAATFASNNIKTQLGHEPHEFLDDPSFWTHHIHPEDAPRVFGDMAKLFKTGHHVQEYRFRHRDGSYRWMRDELVLVEDNDGTPLEVVGYWVDITDRKRAEEAVKQINRALKFVSECNAAIVRARDEAGLLSEICRIIVELGNQRMAWVGIAEHDAAKTVRPVASWGAVEGYLDEIKVSWSDRGAQLGPVAMAINTGNPHIVKDTADDSYFSAWREAALKRGYHSMIAVPLTFDSKMLGCLAIYAPEANVFDAEEVHLLTGLADNIAFGIGAIRTEAERAEAERALRESAEQLARSNRELQDFAYVASHDLQEPLRKIEAFGDRLQTKCEAQLSDDGKLYLERMQNAAARMRALINSLLSYSRVTTKAQPFAPLNLTEAVKDAVSDLQVRIERTGATIEIGDMPTIDADSMQFRQLLLNLVGNALKFQKEGDKPIVRVTAELCGRDGKGPAPANPYDVWCKISVADNGIGFEDKYVDKIFNMFQRLHGRNEYEGTGIGLATCRKIVERHGGTITATSQPGQGATFIALVPVKHVNKE
jgi:PAS domain S-box-containing protein